MRETRTGLVATAVLIGFGAGAGAFVFRTLIAWFTWLFTTQQDYGLSGRASSAHLSVLGPWFVLVTPVVGGLLIGPLIYIFAREARGHGVPEVMLAVAENGGRIRPRVTAVKAVASAICIGSGGSVGREGPIVQIGSALASTFGQVVRMPESRLRVLVACGAGGAISATFNAPLAGVFFGLELILREVSAESLVAVLLASMTADAVGQAAFGRQPFFALPPAILPSPLDYLLCLALGVAAGLIGSGFGRFLYLVEDACDRVWRGRPEWLRPAAGGLVLGGVLLAMPQLYGVGYPVMQHAVDGGYAVWFLLALLVGKIVASSLTIGIGGSGGVFAPSLFIGAMLGTAFGLLAQRVMGPASGPVAAYGIVGMGAAFAGAARAPLTSISSVLEMTGDFNLVLPIVLAVGVATGVGAAIGHGTIYTTKLLRRGVDIERPRPATLFQQTTVAEAMRPVPRNISDGEPLEDVLPTLIGGPMPKREPIANVRVSPRDTGDVQAVFENETLEQALRQLVVYGHGGLPVLAGDGSRIVGWISNQDVMRAFARKLGRTSIETARGARVAEQASGQTSSPTTSPVNRLPGYRLVEVVIDGSTLTRRVRDVDWPRSTLLVAVKRNQRAFTPSGDTELRNGDRLTLLAPAEYSEELIRGSVAPPD